MRGPTAVLRILGGVAVLLAASAPVLAESIYWAEAVSGVWSDSTNWLPEQVPGPGDAAFITTTGDYTVTLDVDAEVEWVTLGATGGGTQTLLLDGRILTLGGSQTTLQGSGELELTNGSSVVGAGSIRNTADLVLSGSSVGVPIINMGEIAAFGAGSIDGDLTTGSGSVLRVNAGAELTVASGFSNHNFIFLSGDGGVLNVTAGTLTNSSGAFMLATGTGAPRTVGAEIENHGTMTVGADVVLSKESAAHSNLGIIHCVDADLTIEQTGTDPSFANTGTIRIGVGHSLTVTGGVLNNDAGGVILGEGTLDVTTSVFTNAGEVSPGFSAGILTVTGGFAQAAAGTVSAELGGLLPGDDFDQLAISDAAALDGTLAVTLIDGFAPELGEEFAVLTYGSYSGAFAEVTGTDLGAGLYLSPDYRANEFALVVMQEPDMVEPIEPDICITPLDPCLTIPFQFNRQGIDPVRAYSVTFSLSPELQLCDGVSSIVEGPFLRNYCGGGCTFFQANDNMDGSYTVDCTILGGNCGPDSSGTLFTVDVTHTGSDGEGTMAVGDVAVRDCDNVPIVAAPGEAITIGIDVTAPPEITDLAATQVKSGNDDDGTTAMTITFTGDTGDDTVQVFRKGFGHYPEYDDEGGAPPTPPATVEDALAGGWTLTDVVSSGQTDEPAERDYWYYIMFVTSHCDLSSVSNMTDGTLNYHLGDVSNGFEICAGDNDVATADISLLGAHYFQSGPAIDSVACLDVGPTDDYSVDGLPTTDDQINFEDAVLFGINFGEVSLTSTPVAEIPIRAHERVRLMLRVDASDLGADGILIVRLALEGNRATVKGIHSLVSYDPQQLTLLEVRPGTLLDEQAAQVFHDDLTTPDGVWFDAVSLGRDRTFHGSGDVAVYRFQTHVAQAQPVLQLADLRDARNRFLLGGGDQPAAPQPDLQPGLAASGPVVTQLLGARPNPCTQRTEIVFRLADEQNVSLRIYDVGGRLLRTLLDRAMPAGEHQCGWDGRRDDGTRVGTGIYFYDFRSGGVREQRDLFLLR